MSCERIASFEFSSRNQNSQFLALSRDLIIKGNHCDRGSRLWWLCLQHLHDFIQTGHIFSCYMCHCVYICMYIIKFLDFDNSLNVRQNLFNLPYKRRHSVWHLIKPQGIAIKKHVTQIFHTRGFDNSVLCRQCLDQQFI